MGVSKVSFLIKARHSFHRFEKVNYLTYFNRFPILKPIPSRGPLVSKARLASLDIVGGIFYLAERASLWSRVLVRTLTLGVLFVPCLLSFPVWYLGLRPSEDRPASMWWLNYLVWTLEASGPTWIKIGQWASSRTDLFPPWACEVLSKLQADIHPHPFRYTRRVIESRLGGKLEDFFETFDPTPVGIGAVAQVYKAKLKNHTDEKVAVKVLHPYIRPMVELDLIIMHTVASAIEYIVPDSHWLSLPLEVEIFGGMMRQQLDLSLEGKNLYQFNKNFQEWSNIGFPSPESSFNSSDILIESWIDGIPMQKVLNWNGTVYDRQIATLGLTSFLKMMLLDNHLHADLHPGNILVNFQNVNGEFLSEAQVYRLAQMPDRDEWNMAMENMYNQDFKPYLFYLDAGLTCSLEPPHLKNFIDLFSAIIEFDGSLISSLMVERSKTPWSVVDFDEFAKSMQNFMDDIKKNTFSLQRMEVSDILHFVFSTVRRHHVKIDGEFANLGVAIMLMEGVGKRLDDQMDLLKASVPFLREAVKLRLQGHISENERGFVSYWKSEIKKLWGKLVY